jgi:hypothetical protein
VATEASPTEAWWGKRRRAYNLALVVAGVVAFATYLLVLPMAAKVAEDTEVTIFSIAFQALGYLVAMALANLCYQLGPWSERRFKPANVASFRRWVWGIGVAFSTALPFSIPVLLLLKRAAR